MNQNTFFRDLRVVELASVLAGPAVGMFFAELGAEVIKIENKSTGGDVTRRWKVPGEAADAPLSAYYCSVNWGKNVRLLDLKAPEDRREVLALIDTADVVISNFKTRSAEALGMDYAGLRRRNPRLIYAQLHAFGAGEERPAFDVVLQAEAGFLYMTGEPEGAPVRMPVALIDLLAAHQLKEGILLALLHRERTGAGSLVSASLFDAAISSLANQATNWLMAGHVPQRMGAMHPNIAPYGDIFLTRDEKPVVVAAGTERQFQRLCACLGAPALAEEPAFADNAARVRNRTDLRERLAPHFRDFDRADLMAQFLAQGVPAGSIRTLPEVFELPAAQHLLLEDVLPDGQSGRRVRTVVFNITES